MPHAAEQAQTHAPQSDAQKMQLEAAHQLLEKTFGYKKFRGHQSKIIETVLAGDDALVLMPTGGGKSLCYQIPALVRPGIAIVVSPLIALMQDQVDALKAAGVKAAYLNSTLNWQQQTALEDDIAANALDLLYIAPERLVQERTLSVLQNANVSLIAIDEAHCVSQWGHDFRPEYRQLGLLADRFPHVPRVALTATADDRTRTDIIKELRLENAQTFVASFDRPNIRYTITDPGLRSVRERLWRFISSEHANDAGIIYCLSRRSAEETADWLTRKGRTALAYHAGLNADIRRDVQRRFLNEDELIVVATIAFGMGIDKPDVRFVAHLNLPKSIEAYYQETGRAGRDGAPANAWLSYGMQDIMQQRQWIAQSDAGEAHCRIQRQKLDALIGLCETATCRRRALLAYFDEQTETSCGNCDNCLSPPATQDAAVLAQKALSAVYRTEQRFGVTYLVNVLLGKADDRITANRHDQLSVFGIGKDTDVQIWRALIRQLTAAGFLTGDSEGHGTLLLTESARPLLRGEAGFDMRLPRKSPTKDKSDRSAPRKATLDLADEHQDLFEALRKARAQMAKSARLPPYIVAQDRTLIELATKRPSNEDALHDIIGLGASKIKRYGAAFLDVIATFDPPTRSHNDRQEQAAHAVALRLKGLEISNIAEACLCDEETVYEHFAQTIEAGGMAVTAALDLEAGDIDAIHGAFESCGTLESGDVSTAERALEGRFPAGVLKCLLAELA